MVRPSRRCGKVFLEDFLVFLLRVEIRVNGGIRGVYAWINCGLSG